MERILLAVDFSESSRQAFLAALELARAFKSSLHVVHVNPRLIFGAESAMVAEALAPGRLLRELQDFLRDAFDGEPEEFDKIEAEILEGVAHQEIVRLAGELRVSLVVVGSHGRSTVGRFFLGSVSDQVLRRASMPVLVVREGGNPRPSRIIAAIDSEGAVEDVLRSAAAWSAALGAELSVVHVIDPLPEPVLLRIYPDSALRPKVREWLQQIEHKVEGTLHRVFPKKATRPPLVFLTGRPAAELCQHALEVKADLVMVGPHEKHDMLDLGNNALRIAHSSPCPVLVARGPSI
jgi:nucleotide-binding universal stress UspA family protein